MGVPGGEICHYSNSDHEVRIIGGACIQMRRNYTENGLISLSQTKLFQGRRLRPSLVNGPNQGPIYQSAAFRDTKYTTLSRIPSIP
jgi:hypothetical protein